MMSRTEVYHVQAKTFSYCCQTHQPKALSPCRVTVEETSCWDCGDARSKQPTSLSCFRKDSWLGGSPISTYGFNWVRNKPFFGMSSCWDLGVFYYCSINLIYLNITRQDKRKLRRRSNFLENLTETYLDLIIPKKINQLLQQWMLV